MTSIGLATRGLFWIIAVYIVGSGGLAAWQDGNPLLAVAAIVLFPITFFVYPWIGGLWVLFLIGMGAYIISTTIGGMRPID